MLFSFFCLLREYLSEAILHFWWMVVCFLYKKTAVRNWMNGYPTQHSWGLQDKIYQVVLLCWQESLNWLLLLHWWHLPQIVYQRFFCYSLVTLKLTTNSILIVCNLLFSIEQTLEGVIMILPARPLVVRRRGEMCLHHIPAEIPFGEITQNYTTAFAVPQNADYIQYIVAVLLLIFELQDHFCKSVS